MAANVLMSAITPAPPDGSKPAIDSTVRIATSNDQDWAFEAAAQRTPGQSRRHGQGHSETLYVVGPRRIITSSRAPAKFIPKLWSYSAVPSMTTDLTTPPSGVNRIHNGGRFNRRFSS